MSEWRPLGVSDELAAIKDGDDPDLRRVFNSVSAAAADATPPVGVDDGFACGAYADYMSLIFTPRDASDVAYAPPVGTMTVRLYWQDENSGEWIPETGTITIPHADAPAINKNHEEQRATYGKRRCAIRVEVKTDPTDVVHVHASGYENR